MNILNLTVTDSMTAVIGNAPLTLVINPSGLEVADAPIVKIEYEFGDGRENKVVKRRLRIDSPEVSAYAFQDDLGDPRNVIVTHNYFPSAADQFAIYYLKVHVTKADTFVPVTYQAQIVVDKIDAVNGAAEGYFEDIHLLACRAYGTDNERLMVFETKNPRYITCLKYSSTSQSISAQTTFPVISLQYKDSQAVPEYIDIVCGGVIDRVDLSGEWVLDIEISNSGQNILEIGEIEVLYDSGDGAFAAFDQPANPILVPGTSTTITLTATDPGSLSSTGSIRIPNNANGECNIGFELAWSEIPAV